jgi:hypothetical protein
MSRITTTLAIGLCLVTSLTLSRPANAEPQHLPAIGSAVGQASSIDPTTGEQTAVARGHGSILGPHTNYITTYIDFATGQVSGDFETVSDYGSTSVEGSYTGFFQLIDGTPFVEFYLTLTFEDGSGLLDDVSGEAEVIALQNLETREIEYKYWGEFEFDD